MMFFHQIFLLKVLSVVLADDPICPSRYSYQNDLGLCVAYSTLPEVWSVALTECQRATKSWLGAQYLNGTWKWSDGSPFDYQRFQSSNTGGCVYLDQQDLLWKLTSCTAGLFPYVCGAQPLPSPTPTDSQTTQIVQSTTSERGLTCLPIQQQLPYTCNQGWQYFPNNGYEYLIVMDKTFADAESYCVSQGAHLASIHSAEENDFISSLCCPSGCGHDHTGKYYGAYITGGKHVGQNLVWTDGSPFDYQHDSCIDDHEDGDFLLILNFECDGGCAQQGIWDWNAWFNSRMISYGVCKRKRSP
ncbi:unnamed protein product, partial [Mesorhabditis belari]|uniref:C-type lectin domain-containing protein n=1 Tax=Mesorhabditis belari TaxID=2138241 RepID=A0AAF3F4J6_9BILA